MDKTIANEVIVNSGVISGGSLMTNMVIFNDPLYIFISLLSAIVGVATAWNDWHTKDKLREVATRKFILFKGGFIGATSTPAAMLILLAFGEQVFVKNGFVVDEDILQLLPSIYLLISIIFSRIIAWKMINWIEKRGRDE